MQKTHPAFWVISFRYRSITFSSQGKQFLILMIPIVILPPEFHLLIGLGQLQIQRNSANIVVSQEIAYPLIKKVCSLKMKILVWSPFLNIIFFVGSRVVTEYRRTFNKQKPFYPSQTIFYPRKLNAFKNKGL